MIGDLINLFPPGSKGEEDEFANLPPEEAKKRLEVIFDKMDKDHDKFVTKDEITAWIMKSYMWVEFLGPVNLFLSDRKCNYDISDSHVACSNEMSCMSKNGVSHILEKSYYY